MISLLAKLFISKEGRSREDIRRAYGILCGAVGIGLNVMLFLGKFLAGKLSGSIAVVADAFNNISDAGSSFVTLLGFYLAGQRADSHHPFGHGRIEYLSGLAVAVSIMLMGLELLRSAVQTMFSPVPVSSGPLTVGILLVSVGVKLYMFRYNHRLGRDLQSVAMEATAIDSLSDCAATAAVLVAIWLGPHLGARSDGCCGVLVALFILWSGIRAARDTIDPLLGTPPTPEFVAQIRSIVMACPTVIGLHDLIVHDYGPGRRLVSLHAEVPADRDVVSLHDAIDNLERRLKEELGCEAVIHMDPVAIGDPATDHAKALVEEVVSKVDASIMIHDFRIIAGPTHTNVVFDAVVPYHFRLTDSEVCTQISRGILALEGNYFPVVNVERSYT